ncbi:MULTISPECIES: TetR/AcrR family transcriptional regulator [unclassified Rhodococcus (in: high G+C Gram-positive bacteria)]|uniref:TetR/AcrR family transcriptional regulator n=1 Tax=unclassified Rhodococcus (in: high G+C Gram-positive bacteria) TaxID=192944 RepID=UPI000926A3CD|nr:TetR/AcrR family transcriptional regulator [Rhodococcus sp. M8]OLL16259.1 TetR family transcriptional regulator [Rhodococcus sp. M8]QPG46324.1 TetR/AcrR family transcriptional regulator C-terminal domain-containing protein [Rhodococcus sp. M8]
MNERPGLSRIGIIEAAVRVADRGGLTAVSMRNVGKELGVEAMSLYHHVANKDDLLDGLADWIFAGIVLPGPGEPWRPAMLHRATSARNVLARHPWSLTLIESRRSPGLSLLRHHDAVLGCLRTNGFPVALASHAFSVIDAYVYGFVLTELKLPFASADGAEEFASEIDVPADAYPYLAEMVGELVIGKDYSFADEFDYGLGLILDELDRRRRRVEE